MAVGVAVHCDRRGQRELWLSLQQQDLLVVAVHIMEDQETVRHTNHTASITSKFLLWQRVSIRQTPALKCTCYCHAWE